MSLVDMVVRVVGEDGGGTMVDGRSEGGCQLDCKDQPTERMWDDSTLCKTKSSISSQIPSEVLGLTPLLADR